MFRNNSDFIDKLKEYTNELVEHNTLTYSQEEFEHNFLMQCSHTPSNMKSIELIEYGKIEEEYEQDKFRKIYSLKLKDKLVSLNEIMYFLEGNNKVIHEIADGFPELSREQIKASLRVMMIYMRSIDCDEVDKE